MPRGRRRRRSFWSRVERDSYLMSRTAGDINAAQHHRLIHRVVRRAYHRSIINFLRKGKLW